MLGNLFSAGNTGDTASTDWQYFRVWYYSFILRVLAVRHCPTLPILRVYSQYNQYQVRPMLRWASDNFSAGNTRDTVSTDWRYFRVQYCSYCEYWQYVVVWFFPCCEKTHSISDYERLYCLNSEYVGVRYSRYCRYSQQHGRILPANSQNSGVCDGL